jgi:hypothetical protein
LTVSFEKSNKRYGFLYETGHEIELDSSDRDFLRYKNKASYIQVETGTQCEFKVMRIDTLPTNIMLLKENCYWFQFDTKDTKNVVSKDVTQTILRQDIDDYLAKL